MFLHSLKIDNYKNLDKLKFSFSKKINCFIGKNGIGKTNIIDSIYHLAFTKAILIHQHHKMLKLVKIFFQLMEILKLTTEVKMYIVTSKMEKRKLLKEIASYIKEFLIISA